MNLVRCKLVALSVMLLLVSCGGADKKNEKKIRFVKTFVVKSSSSLETKVFPGLIKEKREVNLSFRISGPLVKFPVQEGKLVRKGDLIARIDKRDYELQLAASKAQFNQLQSHYDRIKELYNRKSATKSQLEDVETKYKLAKAKFNADKNSLKDTDLRAPFTGFIQKKFVENFEKITMGTPVVSLVDVSETECEISFPEHFMLNANNIEKYTCVFENFEGKTLHASQIAISKKPNMNHLYNVRLRVEDKGEFKLVPGMAVNVHVVIRNENNSSLIRIPSSSVHHYEGGSYIWKYDVGTSIVKRCKVQTGKLFSDGMINVLNGVDKDDVVVTAGVHSLTEGQEVKVMRSASKTNVGGQL